MNAKAEPYDPPAERLGSSIIVSGDVPRSGTVGYGYSSLRSNFLGVPDLEALPIDYVMICTQGFGGFDRRFEGFKRLYGVAAVSRDAKGACTP